MTDDGRLYLTDCATETGTWRQDDPGGGGTGTGRDDDRERGQPRWHPIRQGFVRPDEPLRLGEHRCTAGDLVGRARARTRGDYDGDGPVLRDEGYEGQVRRLRGRVERDAATGEIVRRRP